MLRQTAKSCKMRIFVWDLPPFEAPGNKVQLFFPVCWTVWELPHQSVAEWQPTIKSCQESCSLSPHHKVLRANTLKANTHGSVRCSRLQMLAEWQHSFVSLLSSFSLSVVCLYLLSFARCPCWNVSMQFLCRCWVFTVSVVPVSCRLDAAMRQLAMKRQWFVWICLTSPFGNVDSPTCWWVTVVTHRQVGRRQGRMFLLHLILPVAGVLILSDNVIKFLGLMD